MFQQGDNMTLAEIKVSFINNYPELYWLWNMLEGRYDITSADFDKLSKLDVSIIDALVNNLEHAESGSLNIAILPLLALQRDLKSHFFRHASSGVLYTCRRDRQSLDKYAFNQSGCPYLAVWRASCAGSTVKLYCYSDCVRIKYGRRILFAPLTDIKMKSNCGRYLFTFNDFTAEAYTTPIAILIYDYIVLRQNGLKKLV